MWPKRLPTKLPNIHGMIPPAPEALHHKLRSVDQKKLLAPNAPSPVPSPCVSVCRMDTARQYCVGCLRTLEELRAWGSADDNTKRDIWQRVRERCNVPAAVTSPSL